MKFNELFPFAGRVVSMDDKIWVCDQIIILKADKYNIRLSGTDDTFSRNIRQKDLLAVIKSKQMAPVNNDIHECEVILPNGIHVPASLIKEHSIDFLCMDVSTVSQVIYPLATSQMIAALAKVFDVYGQLFDRLKHANKQDQEKFFELIRSANQHIDAILSSTGGVGINKSSLKV